jgi:hypothetical protein
MESFSTVHGNNPMEASQNNQKKCESAISFLSMQPKEMKSVCQRDIKCITSLFTLAKIWNHPLTDEWIKTMWKMNKTGWLF